MVDMPKKQTKPNQTKKQLHRKCKYKNTMNAIPKPLGIK